MGQQYSQRMEAPNIRQLEADGLLADFLTFGRTNEPSETDRETSFISEGIGEFQVSFDNRTYPRNLQLPRLKNLEAVRPKKPTRRESVMLVLTRQIGEEIVIAGDIRVTVVAVKGQRVRLGIAAPLSVPVARMELLDAPVALRHRIPTDAGAQNRWKRAASPRRASFSWPPRERM